MRLVGGGTGLAGSVVIAACPSRPASAIPHPASSVVPALHTCSLPSSAASAESHRAAPRQGRRVLPHLPHRGGGTVYIMSCALCQESSRSTPLVYSAPRSTPVLLCGLCPFFSLACYSRPLPLSHRSRTPSSCTHHSTRRSCAERNAMETTARRYASCRSTVPSQGRSRNQRGRPPVEVSGGAPQIPPSCSEERLVSLAWGLAPLAPPVNRRSPYLPRGGWLRLSGAYRYNGVDADCARTL